VRVLTRHHCCEVLLDLLGDELALGPVPVLKQRLQQAAPVVLIKQVLVFVLDDADGFSDERVLLIVADILLLQHQLVVNQAQVFN
jgi:hypothetical protein